MSGIKSNIVALLLFLSYPAFSQKLEEKLIIRDGVDSVLQNAFRCSFDTMGNYYFETITDPKNDNYELITNTKKYNGLYWGYDLALKKYKSVTVNAFFADRSKKLVYYKNKNGTKIYGPVRGKIKDFYEYGKENIAIEFSNGDTSFFYINNTLVNITDTASQYWQCSFSNNNNALFTFYRNGKYRLYLNSKLIDSSAEPITDLAVNDHKFYAYVKTTGNYYTVNTAAKNFGPYRGTTGFNNLLNDDSYYIWGCDDSLCVVLINGKEYKNIKTSNYILKDVQTGRITRKNNETIYIEIPDKANYIFSYNQYNNDSGTYINSNGIVKRYKYDQISYIFQDKSGKYAFYGDKVDAQGASRTYKVVNGKEQLLLKPGGYNAIGVQALPDGKSFYYYESADSVYLYKNDTLMYHPITSDKFMKWDERNLSQNHREGNEFFQCYNIDTFTIIAYNNTLSKKLPLINLDYNRLEPYKKGNIVASDINDKGYFIIEYLAPERYFLIINNTIYQEISGIDRIFGGQSYFGDHCLYLYVKKGDGFYQYKYHY